MGAGATAAQRFGATAQAPSRLVSRSCPNGSMGVMLRFKALGASGLGLLAGLAFASARLKVTGCLQLPAGDAQPDRRVSP
jgi:hypothetical protein